MGGFLSIFVFFAEPNFPTLDVPIPIVEPWLQGDSPTVTRNVDALRDALRPGRVLVWRHGSAVPAEAWGDIYRFLESGGGLVYLGGEPFTRPVTGPQGQRVVQPRTVSMLKALRLNQCRRVDAGDAIMWPAGSKRKTQPGRPIDPKAWVGVLEPRLTDGNPNPDVEGEPGPRNAVVRQLYHLFAQDEQRFLFAAAAMEIDHLSGFAEGGRWVFWLVSERPGPDDVLKMIDRAASRPPIVLKVYPTRGCFRQDEGAVINMSLKRTRASSTLPAKIQLTIDCPNGEQMEMDTRVDGESGEGEYTTSIRPKGAGLDPGLYRVTARCETLPEVTTGFWVFDRQLFESGGSLTFDGYTLRRDGKPEPVVGTTFMSSTVHRDFLFEPNAAEWDDTFAELASLKINLVRTGVWSGWKRIAAEPGKVDEAWLRALEAYYLTARKHGIAVIFTFFAFLPETWGGENPYFDPRAVAAQQAYVRKVARRFAPAKEMMWDFINEPSFSSAKHLWLCRPNGDWFERQAFRHWLAWRFDEAVDHSKPWTMPPIPASQPATTQVAASRPTATQPAPAWEIAVRNRWRLLPDEPIDLPTIEDFSDRTVFENRRPYRAADYILFAQDAFADWTRKMTAAVREGGSTAAVSVGQDEGGLTQRPSPLFHHDAVDFTSMHTWWHNDALLWDGLCSKVAGKPLLVSETGVMNRELLSGEAIRSVDDAAALLSRKIAYAFASGAFGVVQWCYDVNPYMASDNEVAIGLRRVDGSYKPEHRVLREFAAFVHRNRERFESPAEPEVVLVLPSAEQFSPRDLATPATKRAVDALSELQVPVRVVPEYRLAKDLGRPKAIILPACKGISQDAWRVLQTAVRTGSVLTCDGWFEADDTGLPAARLGYDRRSLRRIELIEAFGNNHGPQSRPSSNDPNSTSVRFAIGATESWFAASGLPRLRETKYDGGRILHHPIPLEWSEDTGVLRDYYATGLSAAGVAVASMTDRQPAQGLVIRRIQFRDSTLVVAINESSADRVLALTDKSPLTVPAGYARMAFYDTSTGKLLDQSHPAARMAVGQ